jgi:4'-phosphopantetheinyl transferase
MRSIIEPINIFWLNLDLSSATVLELSTTLSPRERQRVARYSSATDQRRAIVSLARRKKILADICDQLPEDLIIRQNSSGKPFVNTGKGTTVEMSSSQSGSVGLFAVTRQRSIGVDVESLSEIPKSKRFASWVATPSESRAINALEQSERTRAYLRLWTRKEAYFKATGEGIGSGITHIDVPVTSEPSGQPFRRTINGARWLFHAIPCPRADLEATLAISVSTDAESQLQIIVSQC